MDCSPSQSSVSPGVMGSDDSSPAMLRFSLNQAPRSASLQRSLQNGRHGETLDHSTDRSQVGHLTIVALGVSIELSVG